MGPTRLLPYIHQPRWPPPLLSSASRALRRVSNAGGLPHPPPLTQVVVLRCPCCLPSGQASYGNGDSLGWRTPGAHCPSPSLVLSCRRCFQGRGQPPCQCQTRAVPCWPVAPGPLPPPLRGRVFQGSGGTPPGCAGWPSEALWACGVPMVPHGLLPGLLLTRHAGPWGAQEKITWQALLGGHPTGSQRACCGPETSV